MCLEIRFHLTEKGLAFLRDQQNRRGGEESRPSNGPMINHADCPVMGSSNETLVQQDGRVRCKPIRPIKQPGRLMGVGDVERETPPPSSCAECTEWCDRI